MLLRCRLARVAAASTRFGLASTAATTHTAAAAAESCSSSSAGLSATPLPADVDAATGLCAAGNVRIAKCSSESKGFGAFAVNPLEPGIEVGRYQGEALTFGELMARYGGGGESHLEYEAANWQAAWVADRQKRGVGVTGTYVFNAGSCPTTNRIILVDAEDPQFSNWTRFINHSARQPNLEALYEVEAGTAGERGTPVVRFVVLRAVAAGDEVRKKGFNSHAHTTLPAATRTQACDSDVRTLYVLAVDL